MRGAGPFMPALLLLAALPLQPTSASPSSWFKDRAWLAIATVASYDRAKETLFISGTVNPPKGVTIPNLITSLGGLTLTVPSILSSVKLSSITGNRAGGVTLVSLTGSVTGGICFFFFQKSGAAVDIPTFKFADLVACTTGPDISTVPFFSTLTIPRIELSIASVEIRNNMLSSIFPADSPLAKLGTIMPASATASFVLSMGGVQGLIADFASGKLNFQVPTGAVLTLASVVGQIPELKTLINSLPQPIQDIGNTQLSKLLFLPSTREFQVTGSLASLTVIPNFLQLQKSQFNFSVILGKGAQVKFVKLRGNWLFNSLSVTTEVFYERGLLLISGAPASASTLNIKQFIKGLTNIDLNIPAALDALKVTKVVGNIQNGVLSLVLLGEIAGKAQVSIVFEHTQTGRIVAFAADVKQFKLSDLVLAGTTLDITAVPFFGNFIIPSVSFVLSSKQFSTANFPDMTNVGVPVPKELGLPTIPAGIAGKFLATIGNTAGLDASLVGKVLTIAVPPNVALSLSNLLTSIPEIQPVITSLPATVKDVINARITQLVFNAETKNLLVSLELDTLTLAPQVVTITKLKISLDASLVAAQLVEIQELSLPLDQCRGRSIMDTWSLPAKQRFENPTSNVFEQWLDCPTAAAYPLEQWFPAPTAETPNEDAAELDELPETRFPNGAPVLPHTPTSQDLPDALKQWYEAHSAVTIPEVADDQAVAINALAITATWNIAGISIATTITYDKQMHVMRLSGVANPGQGVSICDTIKVFTTTAIPVPSVLSSLKVTNVVAAISDTEITVVLTATTGGANVNANVYIIFQKKATATAAAIAAEIQSFTIVDLVKTAANVDLTGVPFVGSFVSTVAFSASTNLITSPLAARTFVSGGPLQRFAGKLPKGATAHFEVQINGKAGVAVSYSGGKLTFTPPKAGVLLSDLLSEMPQAISSIVNSLPAPLSDLRTTTISAIDFDAATKTLSATSTIPQLTIIPTKMVVTDIQASFVAILSSTNGGLKSLDFTADWVLETATVRMSVSYDKVLSMGGVQGLIADFASGKLNFQVPTGAVLTLASVVGQIPELKTLINSLPQPIQDIGNTQLSKLLFLPSTGEFQMTGSLASLTVIPNFLQLPKSQFDFSVILGKGAQVKFVKFRGNWLFNSLSVTTEVFYERGLLLISGAPASASTLNIKQFIKGLTNIDLNIPAALDALKVTKVVGKIQNGVLSLVLLGEIAGKAQVSIVFEHTQTGRIVAFAADVKQFKLSDLVLTGTTLDITAVPFFGNFIIPSVSFVLSSKQFSTANFPDMTNVGVPVPKELGLPTIPAGIAGKFLATIGNTAGLDASLVGKVLTIAVPPNVALSLSNLLTSIPEIQPVITSLPATVKDVINARITQLVFNAETKNLLVSLELDTLTLIPRVMTITKLKISLDASLVAAQLVEIQELSLPLDQCRGRSVMDTWSLPAEQRFQNPTSNVFEQSLDSPTAAAYPLEQWFPAPTAETPTAETPNEDTTELDELPETRFPNGAPVLPHTPTSQDLPDALKQWYEAHSAVTIPEVADDQAVAINALAITATWNIAGISIATTITYDKQMHVMRLSGVANSGQGVSISDTIKVFTTTAIPVPSVLSSLKVANVVAAISDTEITVVLTATTGGANVNANVYIIFQKKATATAAAIAAEIQSFTIVDLVKTAVNVDLTGVPFVGSFVSTVAFSASTNLITSPLAARTFVSGGPLQRFAGKLPKGATAHFEVQINGKGGVAVSYSGGKLTFTPPKAGVLLSDLLSEMPQAISSIVNLLPAPLSDLRTTTISAIDFDAATKTLSATSTIPQLTIIPTKMVVTDIQASFVAILSSTNGGLKSLDFTADWVLGTATVRMSVSYDKVLSMGGVQGLIADFASGKLNFQVPTGAVLTLASVVGQIPELKTLINSLPQPIQDIGNTQLSKLLFLPSTGEFQMTGSLASLTVIPNFLQLQKSQFDFSVILGKGAQVKFVKFRGNWLFNSLSVTTEVFYERGLLLISGAPASASTLNIKQFIKGLTNIDLNIPAALDALKVTKVVGNIQNGVLSLVLLGEIAGKAQVSIVFEHTQTGRIVAFAADVKQFKLSDLVLTGTTLDITAVPFFGNFIIPSVSFVLSSKQFSTANFPDMTNVGVPVPKELGLPTIPAGIAGKFLATIGNTAGLDASLVGKVLTIAVPPNVALSLSNLLTSIPEIQPVITSLPATVKDVINARITQLVFNAETKNLLVSLELDTLTLIPRVMTITKLKISLDASLVAAQLVEIQELSLPLDQCRGRSAMDTWSLPAEQRFENPTSNVFEQWLDCPTAAAYPLEQWFPAPTAETPNEDAAELDELPETRFPNGAPVLPHTPTSQDLPDALKQWYEAHSAVTIPEVADDQAVAINALAITATWNIAGISIATTITYDKQMHVMRLSGVANSGQGVSIADTIKVFTTTAIPVPSVLSSLKVANVVAAISDTEITVVLTATTGGANVNANVYIIFQKKGTATAAAIAAEIQSFTIVDLVKTAANVDLTGVPFVGSFVSTVAFSASTNLITSPLAARTFVSGGPLQRFAGKLPKGATAHFEVQINGKAGVAVSYSGGKLTFTPPKAGVLLSDLLSEMPQAISSIVNLLPAPLSDLRTTTISAIDFDAATKTLSATSTIPQLTIIPTKMVVTDIQASFVAILSSTNRGLKSLDFMADWVLGTATVRMSVSYDKVQKVVVFSATPMQGLDIQQLIASLTGASVPLPSAINTANLTKIVGRKTGSGSTFIFSGTIANKAEVHLVYQVMGQSSQVGIAAGISSFTLDELVKSAAVGISITGVPFFGTFSIPAIALAVANQQLTAPLLPQVVPATSPVAKYGSIIPGGFTAKFDAPAIGNVLGIVGSYDKKVLSFTVPPTVDASLGTLMSEFSNTFDVNAIGVGPVFGNLLTIKLKGFTLDLNKKAMTVNLFMGQVKFYENILTIRDIKLELLATFFPVALSAEASATISLGKIDYAVAVGRDAVTNKYELSISTPTFPITGFISSLGASFLPQNLHTLLTKALVFNVLNAKVVYPLATQPPQIELSGNPELFGQAGAVLKAVAFKYSGKVVLVQKYNFPSFNLADLLQYLLGVSLHKLGFLNQNMDFNFVLSPSNIKGVKLSLPDFQGFSLSRGMSFKVPKLPWPKNCASDPLCNTAKKLIGNLNLSLEGTITNLWHYVLTATVGDLKLGGGVVLLQASLQFEGGVAPSVGIVGNIIFNPEITFQAAIRATPAGVKLKGSMTGCWNNAFGWDSLKICNLLLSVTVPLTRLEYGGKVVVGKPSCGQPLTAQGYVGINRLLPTENYFYADVGPVTFQKFFDAFCFSVTLPQPLTDSGFPNGFKTSASPGGVNLPNAGITIPSGFTFRGTFNILGLVTYINLRLQVTGIIADVKLPPVNIGSVLSMYLSSTDRTSGPVLHVEVVTRKPPIMEAQGFISVFGMELQSKLVISSKTYTLDLTGKFLKLFQARLLISATYSKKDITSSSFMVEGWFKNDLFVKITNAVRNGLDAAAKEAEQKIDAAKAKVTKAQGKLDSVTATLTNAQRHVNNAMAMFNVATSNTIGVAKQKINNICQYRTCLPVCVGCVTGFTCFKKVFGVCVLPYPQIDSCCTRIADPGCVAANAACALAKEPLLLTLDFAEDMSKDVPNAANLVLEAAKKSVQLAKGVLDEAKVALEGVKQLYIVGTKAASAIVTYTLTKIISITEMYFKVELSVANGGSFQCRVKGTLVGQTLNQSFMLDTRNILGIAKSIAEKAIPGVSKYIG